MSLEEIRTKLEDILPELRSKYGLVNLWLFGSYVRAEEKPTSDLDILVEIDNPQLSLLDFITLENHLAEQLGVRVDLVEMEALKPAIGKNILNEALAI